VTLAKELSGLRRFLGWCGKRGYLTEMPHWDAPKPTSDHQPICLTREQMEQLLAELPERTRIKKSPARAWFVVMWATSFRKGTMARLRWEDVDLKARTITVRASADKKKYGRTVPLTEAAVQALKALSPGIGLVFGTHDFRQCVRAAAKRAKLPENVQKLIANHFVRHSRLTDMASRSKNIAAIQHMAGHKNLASTMRYVHGSLEGARALLEEVERVDEEAEKNELNSSHSGQVSGQDDKSCPGKGS
jgi:site-specific recombinase XerD